MEYRVMLLMTRCGVCGELFRRGDLGVKPDGERDWVHLIHRQVRAVLEHEGADARAQSELSGGSTRARLVSSHSAANADRERL